MKLPTLDEYRDRYPSIRMERDDRGVLVLTLHTDGSDLLWGGLPHEELHYAFHDVGADYDNKVVILTAAGDSFIDREALGGVNPTPAQWARIQYRTRRTLTNLLDIEAPVIAAVNGPATIHAELALLCDIVLAADTAVFQDAPHFPSGILPGDGVQIVWPLLLGLNRARYFLLTGQRIGAQEALGLGLVNEVLSREELLPRAHELADLLLERPELTLRLTKGSLLQEVRRLVNDSIGHGIMAEGLAAMDHWPTKIFGR